MKKCQLTVFGDLWRNQLWQQLEKGVVNRCLALGTTGVLQVKSQLQVLCHRISTTGVVLRVKFELQLA